jgi:hypothetical protein
LTLERAGAPSVDVAAPAANKHSLFVPFSIGVGVALTTLYFVLSQLFPDTGRSEFAYKPFIPEFQLFSAMRGFTLEQLANHVLRVLVLGPGLLLLSLGLARVLQLAPTQRLPLIERAHSAAVALSVLVSGYVMLFVLRGRAITDDEVTYAAMARTFTRGLLAEPRFPGQLLDFFEVLTHRGVTGKYLFGEPLVQMLGVLVSMPPLVHLPLNALTLFALQRTVQLLWGDRTLAAASCALLAISPMFVLCAATGQSQTTSLTCVVLCILGYAQAKQRAPVWGGVLAGAALAFGLSVRIQSLVPAGAVVGGAFVLLALRTRNLRALAAFVGMSLVGVVLIGLYNRALSGHALELPWFLQGPGVERYGFVQVWSNKDFVHRPLGALQNLWVVAVRMNGWWLGWPLALLLVWRRSPLQRVWRHGAIFVWVSVALTVFELGYYSTGVSDVGPIYHFELLPCLCILAAQCLIELWRKRPELAMTAVFIHVLFGTGSMLWEQTARLGRLMHAVYAEPESILASLPAQSLLLVEPGCDGTARLGWLHRPFVLVTHDPRAPVVIYSRPNPRQLDAFLAQFPERACYYLARDEQLQPLHIPCAAARNQLTRPFPVDDSAELCLHLHSTAEKLRVLLEQH